MQTLALMLAAVALSLLVGMPLGVARRPLRPLQRLHHAGARRDADRPGLRVPDAGRDPLLGRPGAAVVTTMIYAIPPAVRITALGIRGVATNTRRGGAAMGSTRRQTLRRCSCRSRGACSCSSVNQTILFALSMVVIAGPDRRRGPRRRRDERPLLEPRARDPRRRRDRRHGDRARPRHRGDRRSHRPRAAPPRPTAKRRACGCPRWRPCRRASGSPSALGYLFGAGRSYSARTRRRTGCSRRSRTCSTTSRTRRRSSSSITSPIGNFLVAAHAAAAEQLPRRDAVVRRCCAACRIAFVLSGLRPAVTTLRRCSR